MLVQDEFNGNKTLTLEGENTYDSVIKAIIGKDLLPQVDVNGDLIFYDQECDTYFRCENFNYNLDEFYNHLKSKGSIKLLAIKKLKTKRDWLDALGYGDDVNDFKYNEDGLGEW